MGLANWADACRVELDAFLGDRYRETWPQRFSDPLRYPVFGGGKRMRPLLTLAAFEALADDPQDRAGVLPLAGAVELVHTYSLVHDDLPAMDDDDERRGRPTVHVRWDEATAILVGDALLTDAFSLLAGAPLSPAACVEAVACLAAAAGHGGMVGGQAADIGLGGVVSDELTLTRLHRQKTGALIACATELGGIAAGADAETRRRLGVYGRAVGLAFQLRDDRLDAEEDAGEAGPPSFIKLLGREETRSRAERCVAEAISVIGPLGEGTSMLVDLARFAIDRPI